MLTPSDRRERTIGTIACPGQPGTPEKWTAMRGPTVSDLFDSAMRTCEARRTGGWRRRPGAATPLGFRRERAQRAGWCPRPGQTGGPRLRFRQQSAVAPGRDRGPEVRRHGGGRRGRPADTGGVARAEAAGLPTFVCRVSDHASRPAWDEELTSAVRATRPRPGHLGRLLKLVGPVSGAVRRALPEHPQRSVAELSGHPRSARRLVYRREGGRGDVVLRRRGHRHRPDRESGHRPGPRRRH